AAWSVELHADRLDDLGPRVGLRADEGCELLRRIAARRLDAGVEQFFAHLRQRQHLPDRSVQLGHDVARRARGRDDALPDAKIVSGESLGDGWNVGGERQTLRAPQAEDLELLVAPERQRHVDALHAERNVAGENAGDLGRPAATAPW